MSQVWKNVSHHVHSHWSGQPSRRRTLLILKGQKGCDDEEEGAFQECSEEMRSGWWGGSRSRRENLRRETCKDLTGNQLTFVIWFALEIETGMSIYKSLEPIMEKLTLTLFWFIYFKLFFSFFVDR